jgi:hypothetical protein
MVSSSFKHRSSCVLSRETLSSHPPDERTHALDSMDFAYNWLSRLSFRRHLHCAPCGRRFPASLLIHCDHGLFRQITLERTSLALIIPQSSTQDVHGGSNKILSCYLLRFVALCSRSDHHYHRRHKVISLLPVLIRIDLFIWS